MLVGGASGEVGARRQPNLAAGVETLPVGNYSCFLEAEVHLERIFALHPPRTMRGLLVLCARILAVRASPLAVPIDATSANVRPTFCRNLHQLRHLPLQQSCSRMGPLKTRARLDSLIQDHIC